MKRPVSVTVFDSLANRQSPEIDYPLCLWNVHSLNIVVFSVDSEENVQKAALVSLGCHKASVSIG